MPNLTRYLEAQNPVYETVLAELHAGRKHTHWIWFIFPQIAGLGQSSTSKLYAIQSLAEAEQYLADPILAPRLRACTALVMDVPNKDLTQILGYPDDLKFRSSMTLFAQTPSDNPEDDIFTQALNHFFDGAPDLATLDLLAE